MAAAMDKKGKRALYVGGLDKQATEQVLYAAFVPFGPLKSVQVPMDYSTRTCVWTTLSVICCVKRAVAMHPATCGGMDAVVWGRWRY